MYETGEILILASQSPRRSRFFSELGLNFEICPAHVDESINTEEMPDSYVKRIATEKAMTVSRQKPEAWVVAADTIVSLGAELLGKPDSEEEAIKLLMMLSGKEHEVRTGYCVCNRARGITIVESELTTVCFSTFGYETARAYVDTGEPLDKAGAYGIQGRGVVLVEKINGSYSNVVGLPLAQVVSILLQYSVITVKI